MMACPKTLKYAPVSRTMRPVTHTADVAVKSASTGGSVERPAAAASSRAALLTAWGLERRTVPMRMAKTNVKTTKAAGFIPAEVRYF